MSNELKVWKNGKLIPWDEASVHMMSHSFARGSAIFDVLSVHLIKKKPHIFRLDEHIKRFFKSAELLDMELAQTPIEIEKAIIEIIKINNVDNGIVKVVGYYGDVAIAVFPPLKKLDISVFAIDTSAIGVEKQNSISACISKWRKLHPDSIPIECKVAANYLNGMVAWRDANKRGFDAGFLLDFDGFLAECATESIFVIKNKAIKTPPLGNILPSITRKSILEAADRKGLKVIEGPIRPDELIAADEIFTACTPFKTQAVRRIEDHIFEEVPGQITRKINTFMTDICSGKDQSFKDWLFKVD